MALLFGAPILLLAGLENFPPHIPGRIFVHLSEKKSKPVQLPHLYQEGSSPVFRLHLSDSTAFSSKLLSSSREAIPKQLCYPSVLAFIVLVLQRALVSWSRAHSRVVWHWVLSLPSFGL